MSKEEPKCQMCGGSGFVPHSYNSAGMLIQKPCPACTEQKPDAGEFEVKVNKFIIEELKKGDLSRLPILIDQTIRQLADRIAELQAEIEKRKGELVEWREKEGSVCPEDVGFVEYIKVLQAKLKEQ